MPWIPLAVAAVGTGTSIFGSLMGNQANKEAQQAQQRMDDLKAARERTSQIRQARTASAEVEQRGANQGAGMSSSVQSGAAGVNQEAYGNIQYIGYEQSTGQAISAAKQREINASGLSDIGKGISDIGSIFANPENQKEPGSIFGGG